MQENSCFPTERFGSTLPNNWFDLFNKVHALGIRKQLSCQLDIFYQTLSQSQHPLSPGQWIQTQVISYPIHVKGKEDLFHVAAGLLCHSVHVEHSPELKERYESWRGLFHEFGVPMMHVLLQDIIQGGVCGTHYSLQICNLVQNPAKSQWWGWDERE